MGTVQTLQEFGLEICAKAYSWDPWDQSTWFTPFILWNSSSLSAPQNWDGGCFRYLIVLNWPRSMWYSGLIRLLAVSPLDLLDWPDLLSLDQLPPCFTVAGCDSMAVEAKVLRDGGLSNCVLSTLLKARKSTFCKVYNYACKAYNYACKAYYIPGARPENFTPENTFQGELWIFLQSSLHQNLTQSAINGKISALGISL